MEILRALSARQHEHGYVSDDWLREFAKEHRIPLYKLEGLVSFYTSFRRSPPPKFIVRVCRDVSCAMAGCGAKADTLRAALANRSDVEVCEVSCLGRCDAAPALTVNDEPLAPVSLGNLAQVLASLTATECHAAIPPPSRNTTPPVTHSFMCDPYANGLARFHTVRNLVAQGEAALRSTCLERLNASKLRGMGGAGFPTGKKWELVASEPATPKFVVCNADESEPGTFKDRLILSELPHLVIEGLLLAALTIGAERGLIFLRHEYAPEQIRLEAALQAARAAGVLGPDAAGSGKAFDIEVFVSPGGYILGEETALLEALEDKRGEPRNKPPFPGQCGLWGQPTLINNVETFAFATSIIHHGAEWWRQQARPGFAGLKFVSVSGDVARPGAYEIPMGMTVRELIDLAGGLRDGQQLQAFLPGGASSNFLPASKVDTPLDFDAMKQAGSMLGTGAVIVIGDQHNLVDLATNIVRFFRNESCGKCVPCRLGSHHAVEVLEAVQSGRQPATTLQELPTLGETLEQTSICGLGQVALNPILSLMRNLPEAVPSSIQS